MIKGVHTMFYSSKAAELRDFIRDKLQLPCFDAGEGWLIFNFSEAELGVHPTEKHHGQDDDKYPADNPPSGTHHISFYCDDLGKTVAELRNRGVEFASEIADHGYALVTEMMMPGDLKVMLYQPKYK